MVTTQTQFRVNAYIKSGNFKNEKVGSKTFKFSFYTLNVKYF